MIITKMFESMMNWFEPFFGNVALVMGIIALLCVGMGIFYMIKKKVMVNI
ncbi:hypothetical protein [Vagococcus fluvialis]|nr:hypothetical protein [Vagococcus fluvialis]MBO0436184.1 hypothetical protein [Vagococcus fluvialis]